MASILPPTATRLGDLEAELLMALTADRARGCEPGIIDEKARLYADSVRPLLTFEPDTAADRPEDRYNVLIPKLEAAYAGWQQVSEAFEETLRLAYNNVIPRRALLIDQAYADLFLSVGDPLADRYTRMRAEWRSHLAHRPWDAYLNASPTHLDSPHLDDCLNALVRGDDLDVEDALNELTGTLRHAFIDFIDSNPDHVVDIEPGLWKRPEIVVAADFWAGGRRRRVLEALKRRGSARFAKAFEALETFFTLGGPAGVASSPDKIAEALQEVPADFRGPFYRCLMLHPDYEMRRYAVNNSSLGSFWKALTPTSVPCATILSLLEHLAGSSRYSTTQRKVFFDTVYRRLLSVTTRSDVLYARGIVRVLTKLNFFLEDEYFAKMMTLLDYLEAKERYHRIDDATMRQYTDALKREKERVGNVQTIVPDFEDIPLVILRKLARDGHCWDLLAMHPIVKIAKETVPHISTRDRAYAIALNHRVNQEVIRAIGKRISLFPTIRAKLALLSNPRTPPGVSMEYLPDLTPADVERLLRQAGIHPELRTMLRNRYNKRPA